MKPDEFYVGYLDRAPSQLARWLRYVVAALLIGSAFIAGVWVSSQQPFDAGIFEFGELRHFEGIVLAQPYPSLLIERPGSTGRFPGFSRYLLVGPGKRDADALIAGFDGKPVELTGELIYRDQQTLIKLSADSIKLLPPDGKDHFTVPALELQPHSLGSIEVTGEIVDPQCFLGIMKPGFGIPHRACAIRCLAGGVPPILRASDLQHGSRYYLLLGPGGARINRELLPRVAEPLHLQGEVFAYGDLLALQVDPGTISR